MLAVKPAPKKETARINLSPEPKVLPKATMRMAQTQPMMTMPAASVQTAPVSVSSSSMGDAVDMVPTPVCWGVLAASVVTLAVQIWTYMS